VQDLGSLHHGLDGLKQQTLPVEWAKSGRLFDIRWNPSGSGGRLTTKPSKKSCWANYLGTPSPFCEDMRQDNVRCAATNGAVSVEGDTASSVCSTVALSSSGCSLDFTPCVYQYLACRLLVCERARESLKIALSRWGVFQTLLPLMVLSDVREPL
jgi:hypothetical protein